MLKQSDHQALLTDSSKHARQQRVVALSFVLRVPGVARN